MFSNLINFDHELRLKKLCKIIFLKRKLNDRSIKSSSLNLDLYISNNKEVK